VALQRHEKERKECKRKDNLPDWLSGLFLMLQWCFWFG
jgi:hypothetical protein